MPRSTRSLGLQKCRQPWTRFPRSRSSVHLRNSPLSWRRKRESGPRSSRPLTSRWNERRRRQTARANRWGGCPSLNLECQWGRRCAEVFGHIAVTRWVSVDEELYRDPVRIFHVEREGHHVLNRPQHLVARRFDTRLRVAQSVQVILFSNAERDMQDAGMRHVVAQHAGKLHNRKVVMIRPDLEERYPSAVESRDIGDRQSECVAIERERPVDVSDLEEDV